MFYSFVEHFLFCFHCRRVKKKYKLNARSCVRTRVGVETTIDWTPRSWKSGNVKKENVICTQRAGKMHRLPLMMIKYIERIYEEKKASSNKSRKNCANSVSFSFGGRENALPTHRRKWWWVLHTKSIRDSSPFSLICIFASSYILCNYRSYVHPFNRNVSNFF